MTTRRSLCLLLLLALCAAAGAEEVTFRFAPEDGARWMRVGEDRALRDLGAAAPISETLTRQEVEFIYSAGAGGGWEIMQIPRSIGFEVNGIVTQNPILDLTIDSEITLTTDASGQAMAVHGFRQLLRKLEDNLPSNLYAQVSKSYNEAAMVNGEKLRWNGELGALRGATVRSGDRWHVIESRVFAMGGSIQVNGVMRFEGWSELDGVRGFKVLYDWDSTGEALEQWGSDDMKVVDLRSPDDPAGGGNLTMRGSELRVIVPESGQLIYRTSEQLATLSEVPGMDSSIGSMSGRFEDSSVYRWHRIADGD